jgi:WD40-like Beta Propeller Repeat
VPTVDWKAEPGARAEAAALLVLDQNGTPSLVCLPSRRQVRLPFSQVALRRILDVSWKDGPMVAGWASGSDNAKQSSGGELVLLSAHSDSRVVAQRVRTARFSPDGSALAYEVAELQKDGASVAPAMSYVLELATGKLAELGASADPLWEADSKHLRVTGLRTANEEREAAPGHWTSLRARWDRESGIVEAYGRGSAQIPAPTGTAVAWSADQRITVAPSHCVVLLGRSGMVPHSIVGPFCMGRADDRGVRWSPDGKWLAFPREGPVHDTKPRGLIIDVVSVEGGRFPALSALYGRVNADQLAIATAPGSVWFDWSPSGRFLAMNDGASDLRVYDFEAQGIAFLGKGQRPLWSPGGAYLFIVASLRQDAEVAQASVLSGVAPTARIDLGQVRDARWLPAQACDNGL